MHYKRQILPFSYNIANMSRDIRFKLIWVCWNLTTLHWKQLCQVIYSKPQWIFKYPLIFAVLQTFFINQMHCVQSSLSYSILFHLTYLIKKFIKFFRYTIVGIEVAINMQLSKSNFISLWVGDVEMIGTHFAPSIFSPNAHKWWKLPKLQEIRRTQFELNEVTPLVADHLQWKSTTSQSPQKESYFL